MLPQLFVLSLSLFGLSRACNSVQFSDYVVGMAFPTNVCIVRDLESLQKSMKMVCDSSGVGKLEVFEDNLDCSGVPTSVEDPCKLGIGIGGGASCVSTAICDSTPCAYTRVQMYEGVTACNGDSAVAWANYTDFGMVFGGTCVDLVNDYSYLAQCVDGAQETEMYAGSGCSGSPMGQMPALETGCDVANAAAVVISCDQTAPEDTEVTGTGSPSKSPTESPSKGPTASPVQSPPVGTSDPSESPTDSTSNPSEAPTDGSVAPSEAPTNPPTAATGNPSKGPSEQPTTLNPTAAPVAATTDSSEETEGPEPTGKGSGNTLQYLANFITFFVFSIHMIMT